MEMDLRIVHQKVHHFDQINAVLQKIAHFSEFRYSSELFLYVIADFVIAQCFLECNNNVVGLRATDRQFADLFAIEKTRTTSRLSS